MRTDQCSPRPVTVSVITACRNEIRHVGAFLDSLLAQETGGMEWEAVIADGMSNDGTDKFLAAFAANHPQVRVIENRGLIVSSGLNAAIRATSGGIIVRMDVHTEYAPDYLRRCVETLQATGADNVGGPWVAKGCGYVGEAIAAAFQSPFAVGGGLSHRTTYEGPVDTVYLGCWRREVLLRVGLFDERLVRNQDDELNLRLTRAGCRVWQSPSIRSIYRTRSSIAGLFRQFLQYGFWKVAVVRKHRTPASLRHLAPALFVLFVAGSPVLAGFAALQQWHALTAGLLGLWFAMLAVYISACLVNAAITASRNKFIIFPVLPVIFAVYHIAYGSGFLAGLLLGTRESGPTNKEGLFRALTR